MNGVVAILKLLLLHHNRPIGETITIGEEEDQILEVEDEAEVADVVERPLIIGTISNNNNKEKHLLFLHNLHSGLDRWRAKLVALIIKGTRRCAKKQLVKRKNELIMLMLVLRHIVLPSWAAIISQILSLFKDLHLNQWRLTALS